MDVMSDSTFNSAPLPGGTDPSRSSFFQRADTVSKVQKPISEDSSAAKEAYSVFNDKADREGLSIKAEKKSSAEEKQEVTRRLQEKVQEKKEENEERVEEKIEDKKEITLKGNRMLFELNDITDEKTGETSKELTVYLLDKESGDVVRKLPPDDYIEIFQENMSGSITSVFLNQMG